MMKKMTMQMIMISLCIGVLALLAGSCGEPVGGMGKSPVYLLAEASAWSMEVDVYDSTKSGGVADDTVTVNVTSKYKSPDLTSDYADVILQQYQVTYYRPDGKTPVPATFFGHMQQTVPGGGSASVPVTVLKRDAKLRSPLKELVFGGGQGDIRMNAIIDFFGKDLMGNEHSAKCVVELHAYDMQ